MKAVLVVVLVLGLAVGATPVALAHHTGCQPDYPCNPWPPCDATCWLTHLKWMLACATDPTC